MVEGMGLNESIRNQKYYIQSSLQIVLLIPHEGRLGKSGPKP